MSLIGNTIEEQIYNFLTQSGLTPTGACALMDNLFKESGFKANNLQNSFNKSLGMTDEQYTEAVDNGTYMNFVHDSAGYGLAQWTFWSRKEKLQDFHLTAEKSIGDTETQLQYLIYELSTTYKSIFEELKTDKSIRELSDLVLTKFERPKDQSEAVKESRAAFGYALYDTLVAKTKPVYSRQAVVDLIRSWEGMNEADGSYKKIIDLYNSFTGTFPRGTKMQYEWAWCACTWSAIAIALGYTDIMPIEISCFYLIEAAKKMNCWQEADDYVPQVADAVLYDWQDNGVGDNTGVPDHVGTVIEVNKDAGYFVVMEGNYKDAVKKRTMNINGQFIRGFITPFYTDNAVERAPLEAGKDLDVVAHEVIAGTWGNGATRKNQLEAYGYDYDEVQDRVNQILNGTVEALPEPEEPKSIFEQFITGCVFADEKPTEFDSSITGIYTTTANLYMRRGAGKNQKATLIIPEGYEVKCDTGYSTIDGVKWYLIQTVKDGILYTGFSSSKYLIRKE